MALRLGFIYKSTTSYDLLGGATAGLVGCRYKAGQGKRFDLAGLQVIEEVIDVYLEGSGIEAIELGLSEVLDLAGRWSSREDAVFLRYYDSVDSDPDWRSQIVTARLDPTGAVMGDAVQNAKVVRLVVVRLDYWFTPAEAVYTKAFIPTTALGEVVNASFALTSCQDADDNCTFGIYGLGALSEGWDLPSPLKVRMYCAAEAVNQVTITERVIRALDYTDVGYYEGEDMTAGAGVTPTDTAAANDSAGNYCDYAWNGATETQLCYVDIAAASVAKFGGKAHKGIVRLSAGHGYADLWMSLKVLTTGGVVLAEGQEILTSATAKYIELPAVNIPPGLLGFSSYASVRLAVYVRRVAGGASSVDLDFLYLAPVDHLRKLVPLSTGTPAGATNVLIDDSAAQACYYTATGAVNISHVGEGGWLYAYPNCCTIFKVFQLGDGIATWDLHHSLVVEIYLEKRRQNL